MSKLSGSTRAQVVQEVDGFAKSDDQMKVIGVPIPKPDYVGRNETTIL